MSWPWQMDNQRLLKDAVMCYKGLIYYLTWQDNRLRSWYNEISRNCQRNELLNPREDTRERAWWSSGYCAYGGGGGQVFKYIFTTNSFTLRNLCEGKINVFFFNYIWHISTLHSSIRERMQAHRHVHFCTLFKHRSGTLRLQPRSWPTRLPQPRVLAWTARLWPIYSTCLYIYYMVIYIVHGY